MKKILITSLSLLICFVAFAQTTVQDVPQKISYSGVVNKKEGNKYVLVKNTKVDFKVSIKHNSTVLFSEEYKKVQVNGKGQVAFEIGQGTNQTPAFNTLKWYSFDNPIVDVKIQGADLSVSGNITIRTVPYAFHVQTARYYVDSAGGKWEVDPALGKLVKITETASVPVVTVFYSVRFSAEEKAALSAVDQCGKSIILRPTVTKTSYTDGIVTDSDELTGAEITSDMLSVSPVDGSMASALLDAGVLTVIVNENMAASNRSTKIKVEPKNGAVVDLDLSQNAKEELVLISKSGNLPANHPFVAMVEYNLKPDGSFGDKHTVQEIDNGYYDFADVTAFTLPTNYRLPTKEDFNQFMPLHGSNHPVFDADNTPVYRKIGEFWFRYTYKKFLCSEDAYLEILAVANASSESDAISKFEANGDDVAARYFPGAGYKPDKSKAVYGNGANGFLWSSTPSEGGANPAWSFDFHKDHATVYHNNSKAYCFNLRLLKEELTDSYSVRFSAEEKATLSAVDQCGKSIILRPTVRKTSHINGVVVGNRDFTGAEITPDMLSVRSVDGSVASALLNAGVLTVLVNENMEASNRSTKIKVEPKNGTVVDLDLSQNAKEELVLISKSGNLPANHPFVAMVEYNLKPDGSFGDKHTVQEIDNGYFDFDQIKDLIPPAGYRLPTKDEINTFMPTNGEGRVVYTPGISAYRKIGVFWFRYTYKKFLCSEDAYLEILAVANASSESDAISKLNANGDDVAARYFPAAGYKPDRTKGVIVRGASGFLRSSTENNDTTAWSFDFHASGSGIYHLNPNSYCFSLRLIKN